MLQSTPWETVCLWARRARLCIAAASLAILGCCYAAGNRSGEPAKAPKTEQTGTAPGLPPTQMRVPNTSSGNGRLDLLDAAETLLNEQGYDPSWSRTREAELSKALSQLPNTGITSVAVSCARTLCRIKLTYDDNEDNQAAASHHLGSTGIMGKSKWRFNEDYALHETIVYVSRPGFDLPRADGTVKTMQELHEEALARRPRSHSEVLGGP